MITEKSLAAESFIRRILRLESHVRVLLNTSAKLLTVLRVSYPFEDSNFPLIFSLIDEGGLALYIFVFRKYS